MLIVLNIVLNFDLNFLYKFCVILFIVGTGQL